MIRKNQAFINRMNILLDILLIVLSYVLASWIRLDFLDGVRSNMAAVSGKTVLLALVYALVVFFLLSVMGFYNTTRTRKLAWKLRTILFGVTFSILIASALLYVFRWGEFSRGVLLAFYLITLLFLMGKYALVYAALGRIRKRGYNLKHVVVIGTGKLARQYREDIAAEPDLGFHLLGFVGDRGKLADGEEWLGSYEDLDSVLSSPEISEAVIAFDPEECTQLWAVIPACEKSGVRYSVIPFYNDIIPANPVVETIGHSKLLSMRVNRLQNLGWATLKRTFDLVVSIAGLILLSPLMLGIAIGVKRSSPGPVLFRQVRVGYQRKEFWMLKFRSMRQNDSENTAWTTDTDPRKTKFGALIRKLSLDELPQLFNVLKGEMSLVGPRPELPRFVEQFRETIPYYMVKHQVKPGMTGWAQVNGYRGDTSIEKRVELDLWYIDHWSPWLDLKILFRTVFGGSINAEKMKT